jgi:hypothetical protein
MNIQDVAKHLRKRAQQLHEAGIYKASGDYLEMAEACERFTWRPIETAPRDGTRVLLHRHGQGRWSTFVGAWSDHDRVWHDADSLFRDPTHWMPLPESPK